MKRRFFEHWICILIEWNILHVCGTLKGRSHGFISIIIQFQSEENNHGKRMTCIFFRHRFVRLPMHYLIKIKLVWDQPINMGISWFYLINIKMAPQKPLHKSLTVILRWNAQEWSSQFDMFWCYNYTLRITRCMFTPV